MKIVTKEKKEGTKKKENKIRQLHNTNLLYTFNNIISPV